MALNIPLLSEGCLQFPDPRLAIAEHDGLVAVSRDLTTQRLLATQAMMQGRCFTEETDKTEGKAARSRWPGQARA